MPSSARPPDQLAKDLYNHLAQQCTVHELRRLGWFDFLVHDRPGEDDADAIVVAFEALTHLFVDNGNWNHHLKGLSAILGFLHENTGKLPSTKQAEGLKALLCAKPVDESALEDWFYAVYDEETPADAP